MNKQTTTLSIPLLLIALILTTGCTDLLFPLSTVYQQHPTHISYTIRYGYTINATNTGEYTINYSCDLPELLKGSLSSNILYMQNYIEENLQNNPMITWNIQSDQLKNYTLGITAEINAYSYLVSNLNGDNAQTIAQITNLRPDLISQYTKPQANKTTTFIDPNNPAINQIATTIQDQAETGNAFLLGKALFSWLKINTRYRIHTGQTGVQPAEITLQKKTGDCDDLSFLYISLCRAINIPARFIRGYLLSEQNDGTITATAHAWTEIYVGSTMGNQGWIPVECACSTQSTEADIHQNYGVENAYHLRLYTDDGSNESLTVSLAGISYATYSPNQTLITNAFIHLSNYQILNQQKLSISPDNIRSYT